MNIDYELDKLTAPEFVASPVRVLSREEIEALQLSRQITPIEEVHQFTMQRRLHTPRCWDRGTYGVHR